MLAGSFSLNFDSDYSCNARSDILDKYSRFHGKTEFSAWCNTTPNMDATYIDGVRDLIFQINPNYITCTYKQIFETSATNNLRNEDDIWSYDGDKGYVHV